MIQYSLSCGHDFSLPLLSLFSLSLLSLFSPSSLPLLSLFTLSQPPILRKKHQATSVLSQDTRGMCTQCKLAYCPINMLAISVHQGLGRENFRKTLKFTKKNFPPRKFSTIRYITFSITHVMLNQSILGLVLGLGVRLICVILTPFPVHYQIYLTATRLAGLLLCFSCYLTVQIHWLSIINSVVLVCLLLGFVILILVGSFCARFHVLCQ